MCIGILPNPQIFKSVFEVDSVWTHLVAEFLAELGKMAVLCEVGNALDESLKGCLGTLFRSVYCQEPTRHWTKLSLSHKPRDSGHPCMDIERVRTCFSSIFLRYSMSKSICTAKGRSGSTGVLKSHSLTVSQPWSPEGVNPIAMDAQTT